jgi:hypothetical protein
MQRCKSACGLCKSAKVTYESIEYREIYHFRLQVAASCRSQPPTANRFHLAALPRWVGSGPRHDIAASGRGATASRPMQGMT